MRLLSAVLCGICLAFLSAPQAWGVVIVQPAAAASVGTSPGSSSLLAWYDFSSNTNDSTANAYHFNATWVGTMTYGDGFIECDASKYRGNSGTLSTTFPATDSDWSLACRIRTSSAPADFSEVIRYGTGAIEWKADGLRGILGNVGGGNGGAVTTGVWYVVVVSHDTGANQTKVSVNNATFSTFSGTPSYSGANIVIGNGHTLDVDWLCFYQKELTQENAEWFYNAGATRTFSQL